MIWIILLLSVALLGMWCHYNQGACRMFLYGMQDAASTLWKLPTPPRPEDWYKHDISEFVGFCAYFSWFWTNFALIAIAFWALYYVFIGSQK